MELTLADWGFVVGNLITDKYVKSLYNIALASGTEREIKDQLLLIKENILYVKKHKKFLKRISLIEDEGKRFIKFLKENYDLLDYLYNFLWVLLKNGRFEMILDISDAYSAYLDKLDGKKVFYITFAKEVSKSVVEQARKGLEEVFGGKVECFVRKDETLIDGVKLQHNSRILDYSLKSKLRMLSSAIKGEYYEN